LLYAVTGLPKIASVTVQVHLNRPWSWNSTVCCTAVVDTVEDGQEALCVKPRVLEELAGVWWLEKLAKEQVAVSSQFRPR